MTRFWSWMSLTVVATLFLAACGGTTAPKPTAVATPVAQVTAPPAATAAPTTPPAPTAVPTPEKGGTLKILYWQAITTLNPHLATGTKDTDGAAVVLEPLARRNEQDQLVPFLAAEIPTVANGGVAIDGASVTWKLRPGLKWSDGSPFTVDDIIFTWEYCKDQNTACTSKASFDPIKNVEAASPTEVKISWNEPRSDPYIAFVGLNGMILQKAQFGKCIGVTANTDAACQAANLKPVGTNAYMVKEFKPGDVAVYERNPNFRNADKVFFDTVEIKGGGDANSAARAVCETQEVDYAWNIQLPKAVLEPILANGKCDSVVGGSFGVERIVVNFANPDPALGEKRSEPTQPHPFLSNLNVRKAISMAIDRKAIVDQLYGPTGAATCNIIVVPAAVNSSNTKCDRDVEGAKKLLDDAGWKLNGSVREKDGGKLVISFQTSFNTQRQGVQAIVKSNLADIGITVNVKAIDAGVFFSGDQGNPDTMNKFYADLQMYTNRPESDDQQTYLQSWTCAERASSTNQWNGQGDGRYCNKDFDAIFAKMKTELDPAKRVALTIEMNDFLVNDGAIIPLINRFTPNVKVKALQGPTYTTFDSVLWNIAEWHK